MLNLPQYSFKEAEGIHGFKFSNRFKFFKLFKGRRLHFHLLPSLLLREAALRRNETAERRPHAGKREASSPPRIALRAFLLLYAPFLSQRNSPYQGPSAVLAPFPPDRWHRPSLDHTIAGFQPKPITVVLPCDRAPCSPPGSRPTELETDPN